MQISIHTGRANRRQAERLHPHFCGLITRPSLIWAASFFHYPFCAPPVLSHNLGGSPTRATTHTVLPEGSASSAARHCFGRCSFPPASAAACGSSGRCPARSSTVPSQHRSSRTGPLSRGQSGSIVPAGGAASIFFMLVQRLQNGQVVGFDGDTVAASPGRRVGLTHRSPNPCSLKQLAVCCALPPPPPGMRDYVKFIVLVVRGILPTIPALMSWVGEPVWGPDSC